MRKNKGQNSVKPENRNRIVLARFDRLTPKESQKISEKIKEVKRKIAPEARGTIIEGDKGSLLDYFKKKLITNKNK
jgi:hypothetical protein